MHSTSRSSDSFYLLPVPLARFAEDIHEKHPVELYVTLDSGKRQGL